MNTGDLQNHSLEEKKAQPVLFLQTYLCFPVHPGPDWVWLHGTLYPIAKENQFTLTWFNLLDNRSLHIYLLNPDNLGKILLSTLMNPKIS